MSIHIWLKRKNNYAVKKHCKNIVLKHLFSKSNSWRTNLQKYLRKIKHKTGNYIIEKTHETVSRLICFLKYQISGKISSGKISYGISSDMYYLFKKKKLLTLKYMHIFKNVYENDAHSHVFKVIQFKLVLKML